MLKQTEMSAAEWNTCCAGFSRAHHGWLITLATIATAQLEAAPEQVETHWQVIADQARFAGLVLAEEGGHYDVVIQAGDAGATIEHRASCVRSLFRLTVDGAHRGLRIDCGKHEEGESTLIWFRVPAAPEELDDIANFELSSNRPST
jgi:hypothetical protein